MTPRTYTLAEAADVLRIPPRTLRKALDDYSLCRKIGRHVLLTQSDIDALLEAARCRSGSENAKDPRFPAFSDFSNCSSMQLNAERHQNMQIKAGKIRAVMFTGRSPMGGIPHQHSKDAKSRPRNKENAIRGVHTDHQNGD